MPHPTPMPAEAHRDPSTVPEEDLVRFIPLGGLGEVGMNCLALEQKGEILVIDCGVTFPAVDQGVDIYHPRFDYLLEHKDRVRGVFITHGHEDHIGALPYLLDHLDVPVFGPAYALELVRARLAEQGFQAGDVKLCPTTVRTSYQVGSFVVEPIRVTHSIADATALAIRTRAGTIVHTGDFKLDPTPGDGERTDEERLADLGKEGVRLLLSDSTNVDAVGWSRSEAEVGAALEALIDRCRTRVVIGMFASNIQRLILIGHIAARTGRRICLLGRSVSTHVRTAHALGRLRWPSDCLVSPEVAASLPRERVLILAGGTQAERNAALPRLANGTHPTLRLDEGDMVVLSSRVIPGNDRPVFSMMGDFLRAGVDLHTRLSDPGVHASGHAYRDEQLRMIELTQPRGFLPLHGTVHHLHRHAALARDAGVAEVDVAENGQVMAIPSKGGLSKSGRVSSGQVATFAGEEVSEEVLRERARLGRMGGVFVSLVFDSSGRLASPPELQAPGVVPAGDSSVKAARVAAARVCDTHKVSAKASDSSLVDAVRLAVRRVFEAEVGQRPPVTVLISHLSDPG